MQLAQHLASGIYSLMDVHFRPGQVAAAGFELMLVLCACSQHRFPAGGDVGYDGLGDSKAGFDK
jgi:hypothetical protein